MSDAIQGKAPARIVVSKDDPHAVIAVKTPSRLVIIARGSQVGAALASSVAVSQADVVLGRDSSGPGGAMELPCTAFARSLLAAASSTAARVVLGLVIGTNVQAYSAELAGAAAITGTGYVKRTAPGTWVTAASVPWADVSGTPTTLAGYGIADAYTKTASDAKYALIGASYTTAQADARFAPIAVPWTSITGTPTTATGYGIASIDAVPIGATTQSSARFTTVGVGVAPTTTAQSVRVNAGGAFTATIAGGIFVDGTGVAAVTSTLYGVLASPGSAAAAYTLSNLVGYRAASFTLGAASTVTSVMGFWAASSIAGIGTNTYGFYSDIANATSTFQLAMNGTAASYFNGSLGIGAGPGNTSTSLQILYPATITGTGIQQIYLSGNAPATATARVSGIYIDLALTNSVFTVSSVHFFNAASFTKNANPTANTIYGFIANAGIVNDVASSTTYGFFSGLNSGVNATVWQAHMAGTAPSWFRGRVLIHTNSTPIDDPNSLFRIAGTHTSTGTAAQATSIDLTIPATGTATWLGVPVTMRTTAAVYTVGEIDFFQAQQVIQGAGSTVNVVKGFFASNNIAKGATNNYAFYSDINSAAGTWQLAMAGSAVSGFAAPVHIGALTLANNLDVLLRIGVGPSVHPSASGTVYGAHINFTAPSTATSAAHCIWATINTAAAAFTMAAANCFVAANTTLGAGSAITVVRGFWAANGIALGATNYGFYSDIVAAANTFAFYGAGTADSSFGGGVLCRSTANGIGYATGAGGTITQATSKATGVTLSKNCGQVTMNAASLAAGGKVSFVVTNTLVAATDCIEVNVASGGTANAYRANVTAVAAGSFTITVENITAGALLEAPVLTFAIIKGVTA